MSTDSPFHPGEREVQELTGERSIADKVGRLVASEIPQRAIEFIAQQRMLVIGSVDPSGTPWASLIFGAEGFVAGSEDGREIVIDLAQTNITPADIVWDNLDSDSRIGMLVIEMHSRRRLRINGRIIERSDSRISIQTHEAYPNCPKYIQKRELGEFDLRQSSPGKVHAFTTLNDEHSRSLRDSDTMFVATVNGCSGVDVSHRGGAPGFVDVIDKRTLRIPDYAGNSMFNTLGNIRTHPRAGLVFLSFDTPRILQIVGRAEVNLDLPDPEGQTGGTHRFWTLSIESIRQWSLGFIPTWAFREMSKFNPIPTTKE